MLRRTSLLLILACTACDARVPEAREGGFVRGRVHYDGAAIVALSQPGLQISAFSTFPPSGPPHASVTVTAIDFTSEGQAYELQSLPVGQYFILAQLVDLTGSGMRVASGGYPDSCALGKDEGRVAVLATAPNEAIDITLYDADADPCFSAGPDNGSGPRLEVELTSSTLVPAAGDKVSVALFPTFPPAGPPAAFVSESSTAFPQTLTVADVDPGAYFVSGCFDMAGDHLTSCGGPGDRLVYFAGGQAPVTIGPTGTTTLAIDLD